MQFLQRTAYLELKDHLNKPEMSLILGPRQAGKTTLMRKLAQELTTHGKQHIYFNLDIADDKKLFTTQHTLVNNIRTKFGQNSVVVFIDEAQRLVNAGLFLKGLYDMDTKYKFIISGSGSLELKADIIEPMTGRKRIFYCYPLSFTEFAAHKLSANFNQVKGLLETNIDQGVRILDEFIRFGGYPKVILAPNYKEKAKILSEIFQSYVEKDIRLLLGVEKETSFYNLVQLLSASVGNIINRNELSSTLSLNQKTLEKYLLLLEKTYIIKLLKPYFRNPRSELIKSPKVYLIDLGFRNMIVKNLEAFSDRADKGPVLENFTFRRILDEISLTDKIYFWRTRTGSEVDFILEQGLEPTPIEVKAVPLKKPAYTRSLRSFIKKYRPKKAYVVNLSLNKQEKIENTQVYTVPFYQNLFS